MQGMVFNKLGGASIKSIQTITLAKTAFASYATVNSAISAVDMTKTIILTQLITNDGSTLYSAQPLYYPCARLTSSTNVETTVPATNGGFGLTIFIVEFASGVSVERGVAKGGKYSGLSAVLTSTASDKRFYIVKSQASSSNTGLLPDLSVTLIDSAIYMDAYDSGTTTGYWEVLKIT